MVNLEPVLTTCCHGDVALHFGTDSITEHNSFKQGITHHGLASFLYNRVTDLPNVFRCKDALGRAQFTTSKQNPKSLRGKEFPLATERFDDVLINLAAGVSLYPRWASALRTGFFLPQISALAGGERLLVLLKLSPVFESARFMNKAERFALGATHTSTVMQSESSSVKLKGESV